MIIDIGTIICAFVGGNILAKGFGTSDVLLVIDGVLLLILSFINATSFGEDNDSMY